MMRILRVKIGICFLALPLFLAASLARADGAESNSFEAASIEEDLNLQAGNPAIESVEFKAQECLVAAKLLIQNQALIIEASKKINPSKLCQALLALMPLSESQLEDITAPPSSGGDNGSGGHPFPGHDNPPKDGKDDGKDSGKDGSNQSSNS